MAKNKTASAPTTTARGQRAPKGVLRRLLRLLFEFYPVLLPVTLVCILFNAIVSSVPAIFMQNIIQICLLYTSPSPRDPKTSRMPSSA